MGGVYATVLTYNRRELLCQCLDAILLQTAHIESVLVIDNGSTDGTLGMLEAQYPQVEVCHALTNSGASGGFNLATRVAISAGADLVWLMDDDVIPEPQALEYLLAGLDALSRQGCEPPFMISTAHAPDGTVTNVPELDRSRNVLDYPNWPIRLELTLIPVQRATFVSILIPKRTFQVHGYPLSSMFIWGEDSEFTCRVTKKQPGYLSGASKVIHVRCQPGRPSIRREAPGPRLAWHTFLVRNTIYTLRSHQSARAARQYAIKHALDAFRLLLEGRFNRAAIIARGIVQGFLFKPNEARFERALDGPEVRLVTDRLEARVVNN